MKKSSFKGVKLIDEEKAVEYFHPCFWRFFFNYFTSIVIIVASLYAYYYGYLSLIFISEVYAFITFLIIGVLWFIITVIVNLTISVIITSERIIYMHGVFNINIVDIDIDKIQNVKIEQSFIERILNFGSLSVDTGGSAGFEAVIKGVPDVNNIRILVKNAMENKIDSLKKK